MSDKMFDSFMHDKMQGHISPVPGDMWDRIMKEKDRRDKVFFWRKWYGTAALLLLLLGGAFSYFYFTGTGDLKNEKNAAVTNQTSSTSTQNSNSSTSKNETITTNNSESNSTAITASPEAENNSQINSNTQQSNTTEQVTTISKNKNQILAEHADLLNSILERTITSKTKRANSALNNESNAVNDKISLTNIESSDEARSFSVAQLAFKTKNGTTVSLMDLLTKHGGVPKIPMTDCPPAKTRNTNLYVEAYVSPDYNWKKLSSENTTFLNSKDSTEKIQASFTAGIRLAKAIGNHIVLKGGLQYSQINEKFQVRIENERKTVTVIVTRNIQTSPGVFVTISDTSSYEQIGYVTKTSLNRYRNIDVPLLLSYEWGNENIKFALTSGAILNLHSSSKGQTIDTSGAAVTYAQGNSIYKTNMGLGIYASGSIIKPISENMDVFAEPYIRYNISNMTKAGSGFSQKFNSSGINLGIRINIGRQR
jgi:hypothetical protein